ncbi:hypothetical protein JHK86_018577 [Glycine max]|nr:hypothetical protein JHK86_018577 [Glycine max]
MTDFRYTVYVTWWCSVWFSTMAAATATPSDEQVHKVALKVLVDKEKNKVLFAEARKDFVDALFEFLNNAFGDYY